MHTVTSHLPQKLLIVFVSVMLFAGCEQAPQQAQQQHPDVEPVTGADTADQLLVESSAEEPLQQAQEASDIVAMTGFSGVDDTSFSEISIEPDYFCLAAAEQEIATDLTLDQACKRISNRLASVSFKGCSGAKLLPTGCNSSAGFPILVREFPPLKGRDPQARILLVGGTHGDELTSVSVTFRWIEKLNRYHSGLFHWRVAPLMNPDGVLKRQATRTNGNGVDLNRNMPSEDWRENALKYWHEKSNKDPRKFPGNAAASEPEAQWLVDEINRFKPDAIIAVHAPYGVVDYDSLLLSKAPRSLGKLHLNLLGTYPGSLGNFAGINRDIPVITLELPHSWEMPSEQDTTKIWEDIVSWLKKNIQPVEKIASAD